MGQTLAPVLEHPQKGVSCGLEAPKGVRGGGYRGQSSPAGS